MALPRLQGLISELYATVSFFFFLFVSFFSLSFLFVSLLNLFLSPLFLFSLFLDFQKTKNTTAPVTRPVADLTQIPLFSMCCTEDSVVSSNWILLVCRPEYKD